jgi:hypothetical protein
MVRVTIEILRHGREDDKAIFKMNIGNDGTGTSLNGNYNVAMQTDDGKIFQGRVENYNREKGVVGLLIRALENFE